MDEDDSEASAQAFAEEWDDTPRRYVRIEMIRRRLSYADLVLALARIKVVENERNLRNKVARGSFSAVFFMQCLVAMGVESLDLANELWPHIEVKKIRIDPSDPRHPDNWITSVGPNVVVKREDAEED